MIEFLGQEVPTLGFANISPEPLCSGVSFFPCDTDFLHCVTQEADRSHLGTFLITGLPMDPNPAYRSFLFNGVSLAHGHAHLFTDCLWLIVLP